MKAEYTLYHNSEKDYSMDGSWGACGPGVLGSWGPGGMYTLSNENACLVGMCCNDWRFGFRI